RSLAQHDLATAPKQQAKVAADQNSGPSAWSCETEPELTGTIAQPDSHATVHMGESKELLNRKVEG
ncbi:MAG TPA: hypothetical protein VHH32_01285, partial [Gemmatimonadales bacterium]|nr:hypothetical protein [Gemmatimonadales bacterium]